MSDLTHQFRTRRIALGLTQEQAASRAGLSRRTLIDFETGGNRIAIRNLQKLLNAVGLELTAREQARRPTLDELADHYQGDDAMPVRKRARQRESST